MINSENISMIFHALDKQIAVHGCAQVSLVVCGGTALCALGLILRTTKDVDVLGEIVRKGNKIYVQRIVEFPEWFKSAANIVQRDFNLPEGWINTAPSSQVDSGLPQGFEGRLVNNKFGNYLNIFFISRFDQIHFKLYAALDRAGYHVDDLFALKPTEEEIEMASKWVLTQDISENFKYILKDFLEKQGYGEIAKRV